MPFITLVYIIVAASTAGFAGDSRGEATPAEAASGVAACEQAVLGGAPKSRGPIHFYEYEGALEGARKGHGLWSVKLGVVVGANQPVTVRVVPRHQDEAALLYGSRTSASQIRFEPCPDRESTGWAGGLKLFKRKPVTVEIRATGEQPVREVLLDRG